jgi:oxygen-independent coproporphyrinogen-3 oxidase
MAASRVSPHISRDGCRPEQQEGRSARPKMRQRLSAASWTQRTPAGFPSGMPGMALEIDGAVQHAPQFSLQSMKS